MQWEAQHGALKFMDPPYVYNVFKGDREGFINAIKHALANPVDRYILPQMTMSAVEERLATILETDWRKEAEAILEERKSTGGQVVSLYDCVFIFKIRLDRF